MAIIRAKREKNFSVFDNNLLRDSNISFRARGLLTYMLSLPDDWKFYVSELAQHSDREKETAIRSAIDELEKAGYMKRVQKRGENGKFGAVDWYVYDEPQFSPNGDLPHAVKPNAVKPNADEPDAVNQPLLRTNTTKNLEYQESKVSCSSSDASNAFAAYQLTGATLTGKAVPIFVDYVARLGDELVCHAIDCMSLQANKPNFNYLQRILNNYDKSGIKTVEEAIKAEEAFKESRQKRAQYRTGTRGIVQKETLPDWAKPGYQEAEVADDPDKSAEIARLMAKIKDGTNGD